MCGRTACSLDRQCIVKACGHVWKSGGDGKTCYPDWVDLTKGTYWPSYNQAPSSYLPVMISKSHIEKESDEQERAIVPMRWGLVPEYHKGDIASFKYKTINCRSEGLMDSKIYQKALLKGQRCVLLCEGYFEWKKEGSTKVPHFFYLPQQHVDFRKRDWRNEDLLENKDWKGPTLMAIAGLFDINTNVETDSELFSFTVLTTRADETVSWVHDRMPVILADEEAISTWLCQKSSSNSVLGLLRPFSGLQWHEVSPKMGNVQMKDKDCVLPHERKMKDTSAKGPLDKWLKKREPEHGVDLSHKKSK
ncbi:Abasic site processing protein HMCES [Halotydeus destructor]|nr:Abasic site processing protein HMCES [Halotydeus destructor]